MEKKIGIALGSGGAKGLAHIGILKVLSDAGIEADYLAGCSSGSIVGAYYALNQEVQGLEDKVLSMGRKDMLRLLDITSPRKALVKGEKIKSFVKSIIGNKRFSDTKIPFQIIATNLENGKEVRLKKGSLTDAIRASISIPGIFTPARIDKRFYVDGGVVNPTPIDAVDEMGADILIGADLTMNRSIKLTDPNIFITLLQSFEILRAETVKARLKKHPEAILIEPKFKGEMDAYNFKDFQDFIKRGERAAKKMLPIIKRKIEK